MAGTAIGILGLGRMGEAIARAALLNADQTEVYVTRRNAVRAGKLAKADPRIVVTDAENITMSCDYIVVALGPSVAQKLLPSLNFAPRHQIVSVMAEIALNDLHTLALGAGSISRVLTLPSVASGGQLLPCFRMNDAARYLFAEKNEIYAVDNEQDLMKIWSVTGMISATMTVGDVASRWLEDAGIEPKFAQAYARTLFSEAYAATELGFDAGMEHVSTPNGLNAMVRERLQRAGIETQFHENLDLIHRRLLKSIDKT